MTPLPVFVVAGTFVAAAVFEPGRPGRAQVTKTALESGTRLHYLRNGEAPEQGLASWNSCLASQQIPHAAVQFLHLGSGRPSGVDLPLAEVLFLDLFVQ